MTDLQELINKKLDLMIESFQSILYEDDTIFLENMKENNLAGDDIRRYQHWEWTQGVGLFGFWKLFEKANDKKYFDILTSYYDRQIDLGLPAKNINTVAPLLALSFLYEYTKEEKYGQICDEWATWIMNDLPRTTSGAFQHITSDSFNEEEVWDDTLFMTVLFLANYGRIKKEQDYIEEAKYQFLIHTKYLVDNKTGLWYHGWTFDGNHNFTEALWGRGNCWITIAIPEFLSIIDCEDGLSRYLVETLDRQIAALEKTQNKNGMWHTLIDDSTSYVETSATCGFGYGILRAVSMGIVDERYKELALKALDPILDYIDDEGRVNQVSYGTPMGKDKKQFYKDIEIKPMPYGQALAILYLLACLENID